MAINKAVGRAILGGNGDAGLAEAMGQTMMKAA
jgi:hypothetical protein